MFHGVRSANPFYHDGAADARCHLKRALRYNKPIPGNAVFTLPYNNDLFSRSLTLPPDPRFHRRTTGCAAAIMFGIVQLCSSAANNSGAERVVSDLSLFPVRTKICANGNCGATSAR